LIFTGAGVYALYFAFTNDSEKYSYLFYIGFLTILLAEIIIRKPVLLKLKEIVVNLSLFFWEIILILKEPFVALWNKFVALLKFVKDHWIKVILYTLDFAALVAILYFSFNFEGYWWRVLILVASSLYIPCHHYKTVWKVLKFIAIDIFYNPIVRILNAIKAFFVKVWETIDEIFAFIAEHWRTILKEFVRFVGMTGGFVLIIYGDRNREYWYFIIFGVFSIIFFQLLTRKKVMIKFYEFFKAFIELLIERRVLIFRFLGLATVIAGIAFGFQIGWKYEAFLSISIGSAFLLFSHFIFHPKKLLEFLKKIPEFLSKTFGTIWLTLKTVFGYIGDNFLTLFLLSIVIFSMVYGISLIPSAFWPAFDFLGVFPEEMKALKAFIGVGLIVMALVAIILLRWRGELKKLKTGRSKKLAEQIEELWKK
ncbi:MAG: hypothetical protein KAU62_03410, partial [Candidatus Heimdallarchaeota archaeon]|nr:hypothetical protein [Candidatus Heimdallarchaeota archaeon]MCK4610186.1 hypothetical protein [Candidatus Heimdallarchaeota archaeon]